MPHVYGSSAAVGTGLTLFRRFATHHGSSFYRAVASSLADESMTASCKEADMLHRTPCDGNRCRTDPGPRWCSPAVGGAAFATPP